MRSVAGRCRYWLLPFATLPLVWFSLPIGDQHPAHATPAVAPGDPVTETGRPAPPHRQRVVASRYHALVAGGVIASPDQKRWLTSLQALLPAGSEPVTPVAWPEMDARQSDAIRVGFDLGWRVAHEGEWLQLVERLAGSIPGIKSLSGCRLDFTPDQSAALQSECRLAIDTIQPLSAEPVARNRR
jgi:hypothetical protein